MFSVLLFLTAVAAINGQLPPARVIRPEYPVRPYYDPYYNESPKPYSFSYNAPLDDGVGQSSRTETADGTGKVEGSYTVTNDEGHTRVVDYIADQYGFRASIRTNEPGTDNQNPADVVIESAGPYSNIPYNYYRGVRRPVRPLLNPASPLVNPAAPLVNPAAPIPVVPAAEVAGLNPPAANPTAYGRVPYRPAARYPYAPY